MTYDEAKLEAFSKLVPAVGERFIENPDYNRVKRILVVQLPMRPAWVAFVDMSTSGATGVMLSEWWLQLNRGVLERAE